MVEFLSPEWIAALDAAASSNTAFRDATAEVAFVLQQTVTDTRDGDVSWHVAVDHGDVHVRAGAAAHADVTFTQDDATAHAVGSSELSAQAAFMLGKLRIGGDVAMLMEHRAAFDDLDDLFIDVRATTTF